MHTIQVCIGSACHLKGAYKVINKFQDEIKKRNIEDKIELKGAFCLGQCTKAVSVQIDENPVISVSVKTVGEVLDGILEE